MRLKDACAERVHGWQFIVDPSETHEYSFAHCQTIAHMGAVE